MVNKLAKTKLGVIILALIFTLCFTFSACTPENPSPQPKTCKVVLSEGDNFSATEHIKTVNKGEAVSFAFTMANGYAFDGVNYGDYEVAVSQPNTNGEREAVLTLKGVKYSANVEIRLKEVAKIYRIKIAESEAFRCEQPEQVVEEGATVTFKLYFNKAYTLKSIDYDGGFSLSGVDSKVNENNEREVRLTLNNVSASATINVEHEDFVEKDLSQENNTKPIVLTPISGYSLVGYHLNGGEFTNDWSGDYYTVNYSLNNHYRPNTEIGTDKIKRDGYVLTGWNTMPGGRGSHVGLGSRADVYLNQAQMLYAEWEEWTPIENFEYELIDREDANLLFSDEEPKTVEQLIDESDSDDKVAVITAYIGGNLSKMVVPEYIDGYEVTVINTNAVANISRLRTLILPKSMRYVMKNALVNCSNLATLYLYDNLRGLSEDAFASESLGQKSIQTLYINAILAPANSNTENSQFCNKIDMLKSDTDSKSNMVLFGSCSLWYGFNTQQVNIPYLTENYDIYNMGLIGGTCATFQVDIITQYLRQNDVFVNFFELASPYQLYSAVDFDARVFVMTECDYDLLASLDMREYEKVCWALSQFLNDKNVLIDRGFAYTYDYSLPVLGKNGDMVKEREGNYDNEGEAYTFVSKEEIIQKGGFERMESIFSLLRYCGVSVYASFSPISNQGLNLEEAEQLNDFFKENFNAYNIGATIISDVSDSIFDRQYFYDTNYHLSNEGSDLYTNVISQKLYEALIQEETL